MMYEKTWEQGLTMKFDEYTLKLPDRPAEKDIINYRLPISKQKFAYEQLPDFRTMSSTDLEHYASKMWHIREHGQWQLINGAPYYIPGGAWFFFNWWTTTRGKRPDFRLEALEFFWMWYLYIEPSDKATGMFVVKCRRIGDSDKALCIMYERVTRYFNYPGGMQSYTDEEAKKAFERIVRSYRKMPFFFKPKHSGTLSEEMKFHRPSEVVTIKKLKEQRGEVIEDSDGEFLDSSLSYRATVNLAYDGQQLGHYYLDECLKIPHYKMNVRQQYDNIRRVLTLNNGMTVFGKAILTSTVEEKSENDPDNSTVEMAEELWDDSDPNNLDGNGMTKTGLIRIFRGYEKNAQIDEFGFPKIEEARKYRQNRIDSLLKDKKYTELLSLYRKEPETVQEAFSKSTTNCPLHPEMCQTRLNELKMGTNHVGEKVDNEVIIGNLQWKGGKPGTEVEFVRSKDGRWHFSQFPFRENAVSKRGKKYLPLNQPFYRLGCDPFDTEEVVNKGSDGAFTVKRKLYMPHEDSGKLTLNELGEVENVWDMKTNQYVCAYKFRHQDPEDFYKDFIMTAWYFGVMGYVELDKPGLTQWVRKNYPGFLQLEPEDIINSIVTRNNRREGSKTTNALVGTYVGLLSSHISKYIWAEKIPLIITQWMYFETKKRTKFDVAVSTGWTEIADMDEVREKEEKKTWGEGAFYNN
jgi:hypothetical protein